MDVKIDPAARDSAATGEAAKEITRLTKERKNKKVYTRGTVILNPTDIKITGNSAILLECMLDESQDVYSNGKSQTGIHTYGFRAILKKTQGTWHTDNFLDDQKLCTNSGIEQG
jgi:hypothetical protein